MGKARIVELTWPMTLKSGNFWAGGRTTQARNWRVSLTAEQRDFSRRCIESESTRMPAAPYLITLTRLYGFNSDFKAERKWDDDSIVRGFKAIRDGIADGLSINDGDESMATWVYGPQEKATRSGVRIRIQTRR